MLLSVLHKLQIFGDVYMSLLMKNIQLDKMATEYFEKKLCLMVTKDVKTYKKYLVFVFLRAFIDFLAYYLCLKSDFL